MDRTRRSTIETRAIEDHRRVTAAERHETPHGMDAPRPEGLTSGILRELAEQMRHWD
jgi:hypothetical protein